MALTESAGMCLALINVGLVLDSRDLRDALRDAVARTTRRPFLGWRPLFLLVLDGELPGAADRLANMGASVLEALVRLYAGERLIATGRPAEGEEQMRQAREFHAGVGATAYIEREERLLAS